VHVLVVVFEPKSRPVRSIAPARLTRTEMAVAVPGMNGRETKRRAPVASTKAFMDDR
jgi:hypothetical protein